MIIEIDDIYTEDIIEYLRDNNLIPINTEDFDVNKNSLVLSQQIYREIECEVIEQIRDEISHSGLTYKTLKGVIVDYFDEYDIKTMTSIDRNQDQVTRD